MKKEVNSCTPSLSWFSGFSVEFCPFGLAGYSYLAFAAAGPHFFSTRLPQSQLFSSVVLIIICTLCQQSSLYVWLQFRFFSVWIHCLGFRWCACETTNVLIIQWNSQMHENVLLLHIFLFLFCFCKVIGLYSFWDVIALLLIAVHIFYFAVVRLNFVL